MVADRTPDDLSTPASAGVELQHPHGDRRGALPEGEPMNTITTPTTARNAQLTDIVDVLRQQQDVKYDVVVPASQLASRDGLLVIREGATQLSLDGVSLADALLRPTDIFDDGLAYRLDIPRKYLRRMRDHAIPLLDTNVNYWLSHDPARSYFVRGFRTDDASQVGIARAFLSDRFGALDHLDTILAVLDGVRQSGVYTEVVRADLSEKRLRLVLAAPEIAVMAPALLAGYRSPFQNATDELPVIEAGLAISNSETGHSAWRIDPWVRVRICSNGMTIRRDGLSKVHLGSKMESGRIEWSDETNRRTIDLMTSQARDAVSTFVTASYVEQLVVELEQAAGIAVTQPQQTIERVAKVHGFSEDEQTSILETFLVSGQRTAGGVMQAVTAFAQTVDDPDRSTELEDIAIDVLATAATAASS